MQALLGMIVFTVQGWGKFSIHMGHNWHWNTENGDAGARKLNCSKDKKQGLRYLNKNILRVSHFRCEHRFPGS